MIIEVHNHYGEYKQIFRNIAKVTKKRRLVLDYGPSMGFIVILITIVLGEK